MQARLPLNKLERGKNAVKTLLSQPIFPYRELESLTGFLSFSAKVITPGRAFLRRLFDALRQHSNLIRINRYIKADLTWWQAFLKNWNGIRLLRLTIARKSLHIWIDTSGKHGMGGYLLHDPSQLQNVQYVFSSRFPTRLRAMDIQYKEMKAILYAIQNGSATCPAGTLPYTATMTLSSRESANLP